MELASTIFKPWLAYSTPVKITPLETLTTNVVPFTNMISAANFSFPIISRKLPGTSMYYVWTRLGCGNSVSISNVLNSYSENYLWYVPYDWRFSVKRSQVFPMPAWPPWSLTDLYGITLLGFLPPCWQVPNHGLPYHDSKSHCVSCWTGLPWWS